MSAAEAASALEAPGSSSRSVPVEHLDYSFIQSCSDLKHLEQILRVLRSGQDGFYPHLVEFCEKHIERLEPKSRVLRKERGPASAGSFSSEEWRNISEDLQMWERDMRLKEAELKRCPRYSDAEHFPPVRSSDASDQRRVSAAVKTVKTSCVPRPYTDWDRFDVDTECSNIDECDRNTRQASIRPVVSEITARINSTGLSAQERDVLALREKDKGNGAFRSRDYEEAVVYYSRSLSLAPSVAALNNRAQAHIRLQQWSTALSDCDAVLQLEPGNIKALLRRATAHKHLGHQQQSHADLRTVLLIEPHNTTAQKLLMEHTESDQLQETRPTGRKILIQEEDEEEERLRDESERDYAQEEDREEQEVSGAESGIMGNPLKMPSCVDRHVETDTATNESRDELAAQPTHVDAHSEAPPTGHAHQRSEGHRPSEETLTERHTHNNSEHTTAEFELLKHDGNALVRSGCYQDAVDRYTGCLQLKPHECSVYTNRALCFIKLQRFTEARQDCDSALQLHPTNKKALYRRALANKGLKDYVACRSDLQQVLCLDASVTEAEQLLMEVTQLMTDCRASSGTRRIITINEVAEDGDEDDDDDGNGDDGNDDGDEDEGSGAVVSSVSLRSWSVFEFGQALSSAVSGGDLLTCADLLRSVASERLPQLISTQLDGHTLGFIIRALHTHLLHTHPELVFLHLQQLHTAHRLTMVLMLLSAEDRTHLSQIFQKLHAVQTEAFSQSDVSNLANKYM
ncbi:sperm-associated antigen 1 [Carassius gibelio]|uniref:sperm-associated antigen 1 n=1 Tax=Carassius gibelio TaxID=101364 RepID=UPI0022793AC0|nr:sperm-associated antigen 1 [Carassius gibelio]